MLGGRAGVLSAVKHQKEKREELRHLSRNHSNASIRSSGSGRLHESFDRHQQQIQARAGLAGLSRPQSAKPTRNAAPGISMVDIPKLQLGRISSGQKSR